MNLAGVVLSGIAVAATAAVISHWLGPRPPFRVTGPFPPTAPAPPSGPRAPQFGDFF